LWRGGCIIRATFLERIKEAFDANPNLENLLLAPYFTEAVAKAQPAWRNVIKTAVELGIPTPAFSAALAYYDGYRSERLPANLLQAQRDYFGAHTYNRVDKEGIFHSDWIRLTRGLITLQSHFENIADQYTSQGDYKKCPPNILSSFLDLPARRQWSSAALECLAVHCVLD
jgi:hypothetical protein